MIIDACAFVGDSLFRNSISLQSYGERMKQYGITKAIVRPLLPGDHNLDRANRELAEQIKGDERFIGFGRINPWELDAAKQVEQAAAYGLRGIHLHPWEETFEIADDMIDETIVAAARRGFPVYVSTGYPCLSEPLQLLEVALRFPDVTFIATHAAQLDMSGGSIDNAMLVAKRAPNVMFDLSGVYRRDFIENILVAGNYKKVIFGSNSPYMDPRLEIERVKAIQISSEHKDAVFFQNIVRLLQL